MNKRIFILLIVQLVLGNNYSGQSFNMPGEDLEHEGTWLQWPHNDLYGPYYQGDVEAGWVTMVNALQSGEKVHIIAKNASHQSHIIGELNNGNVSLVNIDFYLFPTNDVWIRDNGPFFVYDQNDNLVLLDWGFNGWGNDTPFSNCDVIPDSISNVIGISRIDLSAMVLEGGAIEHDGNGTMIATRSCTVHPSRNPNLTEAQVESYFTTYLGFTKFIWLDGIYGQDITDQHIDGFLKFANDSTIVTMDSLDLDYWLLTGVEISTIYSASNTVGENYTIVKVPLTQNNVSTTYGNNLGSKGSYCNYYIGNNVVIVPVYNDPNDTVAMNIIQGIYPNRTVVGMNVQNLYEYGGMTHCVTQQQPIALNSTGLEELEPSGFKMNQNTPNPAKTITRIEYSLNRNAFVELNIYNNVGQLIESKIQKTILKGDNFVQIQLEKYKPGVYHYQFRVDGVAYSSRNMVVD